MEKLTLNTPNTPQQSCVDKDQQYVTAAKEFVLAHLDRIFSETEMAAHFNMCRSRFYRLFKRVCGETYTTYANRIRMERAAQLLLETDFPIRVILELVGYLGASSYFYKKFKATYGMTPSEYRNKTKK